MPSSPGYKRDYKREYAIEKPERRKKRAKRNAARRKLAKEGRVKLGDGMDVDHKNKNAMDNSKGNLRVQKASTNRSYSRKRNAKKYGNGKRK